MLGSGQVPGKSEGIMGKAVQLLVGDDPLEPEGDTPVTTLTIHSVPEGSGLDSPQKELNMSLFQEANGNPREGLGALRATVLMDKETYSYQATGPCWSERRAIQFLDYGETNYAYTIYGKKLSDQERKRGLETSRQGWRAVPPLLNNGWIGFDSLIPEPSYISEGRQAYTMEWSGEKELPVQFRWIVHQLLYDICHRIGGDDYANFPRSQAKETRVEEHHLQRQKIILRDNAIEMTTTLHCEEPASFINVGGLLASQADVTLQLSCTIPPQEPVK